MKVSEMEARGSKTLVASEPMRQPSWLVWSLMKASRVVMLTVLWSGLGMGFGLLGGIILVLAHSVIAHAAPDMTVAYRQISIPVALCSGGGAFIWNVMRVLQAAVRRRRGR